MEVSRGARIKLVLVLIQFLIHLALCQYTIPSVTIELLKPKGIRASIPDVPTTNLFVFNGNINRAIGNNDVGTLSGEIKSATNGRWVFEDEDVELKLGDTIDYHVFVSAGGSGYVKDGLKYVVKNKATDPTAPSGSCTESVTKVRGTKSVCSGEVLFDETFDSLREDVWQIEHRLPTDHPEYPFVSYQRLPNSDTVKVEGGYLKIQPKLQQMLPGFNNDSIYEGTLNLYDGCTDTAESCYIMAQGANIIPPIASGRLSSKFVFKYGVVDIRAKLPRGDWLYPEILLEPFLKKYGKYNYASGIIKIAAARGNQDLYEGPSKTKRYGNRALYGGVFMNRQCYSKFLNPIKLSKTNWNDDFHTYSVRWEPSRITFSVDGEEIEGGTVEPSAGRGLRDEFNEDSCPDAPRTLWSVGDRMAPFDTEFYLTLGLAAGGITEFKDDLYTTGGRPKPWKNHSSKAKLHFWQDLDAWYRTWDANSLLIVDRVTVKAL